MITKPTPVHIAKERLSSCMSANIVSKTFSKSIPKRTKNTRILNIFIWLLLLLILTLLLSVSMAGTPTIPMGIHSQELSSKRSDGLVALQEGGRTNPRAAGGWGSAFKSGGGTGGTSTVVILTAYTSSYEETDQSPFITASGYRTKWGTAACPRRYKFGTKFYIAERRDLGSFTCLDRMARRFDCSLEGCVEERWDIWFNDKESAFAWGRRRMEIIILK